MSPDIDYSADIAELLPNFSNIVSHWEVRNEERGRIFESPSSVVCLLGFRGSVIPLVLPSPCCRSSPVVLPEIARAHQRVSKSANKGYPHGDSIYANVASSSELVRILRMQDILSKYEKSGDGMTPQVDLAHLLASRDQELPTLSAEMLVQMRTIIEIENGGTNLDG
ncbi:hypothetical protein LXL04_034341 [Taraxacum kok-saghyz]